MPKLEKDIAAKKRLCLSREGKKGEDDPPEKEERRSEAEAGTGDAGGRADHPEKRR